MLFTSPAGKDGLVNATMAKVSNTARKHPFSAKVTTDVTLVQLASLNCVSDRKRRSPKVVEMINRNKQKMIERTPFMVPTINPELADTIHIRNMAK